MKLTFCPPSLNKKFLTCTWSTYRIFRPKYFPVLLVGIYNLIPSCLWTFCNSSYLINSSGTQIFRKKASSSIFQFCMVVYWKWNLTSLLNKSLHSCFLYRWIQLFLSITQSLMKFLFWIENVYRMSRPRVFLNVWK